MAVKRGDLHSLGATLVALLLTLCWDHLHAQAQTPSPAPTIILRNFGVIPTPTPTPQRRGISPAEPEEKPLPRSWLIGGGLAAILATAGIIYGASRVWRSSNLFDRQYHFPRPEKVALRFGGERCGGHLASVTFAAPKSPGRHSEAKDV